MIWRKPSKVMPPFSRLPDRDAVWACAYILGMCMAAWASHRITSLEARKKLRRNPNHISRGTKTLRGNLLDLPCTPLYLTPSTGSLDCLVFVA